MKEWDFFPKREQLSRQNLNLRQIIKKQTKHPPQQNPKIVPRDRL